LQWSPCKSQKARERSGSKDERIEERRKERGRIDSHHDEEVVGGQSYESSVPVDLLLSEQEIRDIGYITALRIAGKER